MATPSRKTLPSRSPTSEILKVSENFDPNVPISPPLSSKKPMKSSAILSALSKKATPKTPGRIVAPPPPPERARKFIVAKKSSGRAGKGLDFEKCRKEAYEALRASQEAYFRRGCSSGAAGVADSPPGEADTSKDGSEKDGSNEVGEVVNSGAQELEGDSEVTKMRTLVMEKAMSSMPEPGSGRVKHLVKAFESLLSIPKVDEGENSDEERKPSNWTLPGLQQSAKVVEAGPSSTAFFSSAEFFPSREFERDLRLYSSIECHSDRSSWGSRTSGRGRNKRNSSESLRRSWNKMLKVTIQHPFKLRTEQRGRIKEEQFIKKVKDMLMVEEKQRIPIAQGLPWSTDEPEVTERINFAEQLRLEREMQRKLEEEEEIRRLRRELVPKAQPMPYFDRPFVPKKSERPRTIPKEPRFHIRPRKSSCASMLQR